MNTVKTILGLTMLAAIPASAAAATGRVILEDPAFHATVSSAMECSAPVDLMLITPDPALLDSDTNDVQRVVDASLAAIRFQCPDLDRVTVHGTLQGDARETFVAVAHRSNDWIVTPQRTFRLQVPSDAASDNNRTRLQPSAKAPVLAIAGLQSGMSLDAAREAIASNFNTEPRLLDNGRRLVVEENGCRAGSNWQARFAGAVPGSRCIEAWFTDVRYPRLYRIEYAEVVTGRQLEGTTGSLVRRYGAPMVHENAVVTRGSPEATRLAWGEQMTADGNRRHPLQATVSHLKGLTALDISLYEPRPAGITEQSFRY